MSVTTKTGDKGKTGLFGGERVSKDSERIHAYGTVDELNAVLGIVLSEDLPIDIHAHLREVQRMLFCVGTDLATPLKSSANIVRVSADDVAKVELWIESLEQALPVLKRFILPSGSQVAAFLHLARTVCRRAERHVVALSESEDINLQVQIYLNRLSDYLFLAARKVNHALGIQETEV